MVLRVFSLFGLAGLFLLISPGLRGHVAGGIWAFVGLLDRNSPYSYVIAALMVIAIFTFSLNRGAAPR